MINETELIKNINSGCKNNVYFLYGEDSFLIKKYVKKIADKILGENNDMDFVELTENASISEIEFELNQISFLGNKKAVALYNYNFTTLDLDSFKKFKNIINGANNNTFIIYFEAEAFDFEKNSRVVSLKKEIEKSGGIVVCLAHKTKYQLTAILVSSAKKRGCNLPDNCAEYLIENCSDDLNVLVNEINKLCLYKKSGTVTTEDIDAICTKTVEANIFRIAENILNGNAEKAINIVNTLIAQREKPFLIVNEITNALLDVYLAFAASTSGFSAESIAEKINYPKNRTFRLKKAERYAKKLNEEKADELINLLVKSDIEFKSVKSTESIEKFIISVIRIFRG